MSALKISAEQDCVVLYHSPACVLNLCAFGTGCAGVGRKAEAGIKNIRENHKNWVQNLKCMKNFSYLSGIYFTLIAR